MAVSFPAVNNGWPDLNAQWEQLAHAMTALQRQEEQEELFPEQCATQSCNGVHALNESCNSATLDLRVPLEAQLQQEKELSLMLIAGAIEIAGSCSPFAKTLSHVDVLVSCTASQIGTCTLPMASSLSRLLMHAS